MNKTQNMIWVTFEQEAIHKYPAALEDPKLKTNDEYDVSFLGYPHRHVFKFKVWIQVFHDDRDIEFIQFKRWLQNLMKPVANDSNAAILNLNYKSCEMIADDLSNHISQRYPRREVWIEVSEDGENGCFAKYEAQ